MGKKYIFLEHTADIKFQAFGSSLEEVFEHSALALKNIISKDKIKVSSKSMGFGVKGRDLSGLLYNFLEEFLYLFETENFLLKKIKKIKIEKKSNEYILSCEVLGDSSENYSILNHVKAITYNEMFIKKQKEKFVSSFSSSQTEKGEVKKKEKFISQVVVDV